MAGFILREKIMKELRGKIKYRDDPKSESSQNSLFETSSFNELVMRNEIYRLNEVKLL